MDNNEHTKEFLIGYIGLEHLAPHEQEEVLELLWNLIHNRIFEALQEFIDEERLNVFEQQFLSNKEGVLAELSEIVPNWKEITQGCARDAVEEFKKVQETRGK